MIAICSGVYRDHWTDVLFDDRDSKDAVANDVFFLHQGVKTVPVKRPDDIADFTLGVP